MSSPFSSTLYIFALLLLLSAAPPSHAFDPSSPFFRDVTVGAGLQNSDKKLKKYGGPTIADLDSDGYPDMLFCHHDSSYSEIYFNNRKGGFEKSSFDLWTDMHGINVIPRSPYSKIKRFTISSGGNRGTVPSYPRMFQVDPSNRKISEVTAEAGITKATGRTRTALYLHMKMNRDHRFPDAIFTNAKPKTGNNPWQFAYANGGKKFFLRTLKGYDRTWNWYISLTDIDNDGIMELISYQELTFFKLVAPFSFKDITSTVLPAGTPRTGTVAVAEFDMDNDGDMDIYVARTSTGDLDWLKGTFYPDLLLENRNGKYVDVSKAAGIPSNTASRGVTTGDFNNDGYMDILVCQYSSQDIMLLNRGDGTFKKKYGLVKRPQNVRGDHVVAVDYDLDGKLDLIVSQGDQHDVSKGGAYRVLKNAMKTTGKRKWLLVRVGNAPDRSATSLHAVVTVTAGGMNMRRRVGSPGDAVSHSFIETVHFGLRGNGKANVKVQWTNGKSAVRFGVKANSQVNIGAF